MSGDGFNSCKAIMWATTICGSIGIGVFEDDFGKRTIRICQIAGRDIDIDTKIVDRLGASLSIDELKRLLIAYTEE